MLFSHHRIAGFVDDVFEPAWRSVRPVPVVSVDLGNGQRFTRTLHGNVATFVLTPDGQVVDIIPGIYDRAGYVNRLAGAAARARRRMGREDVASLKARRDVLIRELVVTDVTDAVEADGLGDLAPGRASHASLIEDARRNERESRPLIAAKLAEDPWATVDALIPWLYREVLHADLEDPLLGLGPSLGLNPPPR